MKNWSTTLAMTLGLDKLKTRTLALNSASQQMALNTGAFINLLLVGSKYQNQNQDQEAVGAVNVELMVRKNHETSHLCTMYMLFLIKSNTSYKIIMLIFNLVHTRLHRVTDIWADRG